MKTILITGVSTGIGKAVSDVFLSNGWFVYGLGRNLPGERNENFSFIKNNFENLTPFTIAEKLDAVFLNSGITVYKRFREVDLNDFIRVFKVNMWGNLFVLKGVLENLKENSIVAFNSSIATFSENNFENWGLYSASKAAMEKALQVFSKEEGFKLLIFNIGRVNTPLWRSVKGKERVLPMFSVEEVALKIFNSIVQGLKKEGNGFERVIIESPSQ